MNEKQRKKFDKKLKGLKEEYLGVSDRELLLDIMFRLERLGWVMAIIVGAMVWSYLW